MIRAAGAGLAVEGPLTFATAARVYAAGRESVQAAAANSGGMPVAVDLAGVGAFDSAALALMLDWVREAAQGGARLRFVHLPENLLTLASLYGVLELIPHD